MSTELRHTVNLVVGTGVTALLALVYASVTARQLGTELFGEVAVCLSLIMAAQTALGPINGIVARFTAEYAAHGVWGKVRTLYIEFRRRVLAWGAVGGLLTLALTPSLRETFRLSSNWPLYISYAVLFVTLWLSIGRGTLRGAQAFTAHNVNTILDAAARLLVGALLVSLWPRPVPALLAYLIGLLLTLAYTPRQLRTLWACHSVEPIAGAEVRRFAWPMLAAMLITAGFQNVDMLYVKYAFSGEEAGVYGAAFTLTRLMAVLVTPFNVVLLPMLTARHADGRSVHGSLGRLCLYFVVLSAAPLALFALWPGAVVRAFSPGGYDAAAALLAELALIRLLGHLGHMIALAGAAVNDFRFLYFYAPLLAVQTAALFRGAASLREVLHTLLAVHIVMILAFGVYLVVAPWSRRR